MTKTFDVNQNPSEEQIDSLCRTFPFNPFYTYAYARAKCANGFQTWLFSLHDDGELISGCTAFLKAGRFNKSLEITSVPVSINDRFFWKKIVAFCRHEKISMLSLNSFAVQYPFQLPDIPGVINKALRYEYILDLKQDDLWGRLKKNHRRNIHRARKAAIQIRSSTSDNGCRNHIRMIDASMRRRSDRGEDIKRYDLYQALYNLIIEKAGCFYQAFKEDEVMSSILILNSKKGVYYHSGGTLSEGMTCGASHFLIHETALIMQAELKQIFFLGGAHRSETGLARYKTGFGSEPVAVEAGNFFIGNKLQKFVNTIVKIIK